jgi:hypothetical protein
MRTGQRTVWLTALLALAPLLPPVAPAASPPRITVDGATARQRAMVAWALGRYRIAGLRLPDLEIDFRPPKDCGLDWAYFDRDRSLIVDCEPSWSRPEAMETLLHELAHAWDLASLSDRTRRAFLAFRGLQSWRGAGTPWRQRGAEQMAEIVAWGLSEDGLPELTDRLTTIFHMRAADLGRSFTLLTGLRPLHAP